jgi:predicted nucleotidyltransferase
MIDLNPDQLEEVKAILRRLVPECEVRVFGSRIPGRARSFSDLDIAVLGDVHDWHALSPDFKKVIESGYENIEL